MSGRVFVMRGYRLYLVLDTVPGRNMHAYLVGNAPTN